MLWCLIHKKIMSWKLVIIFVQTATKVEEITEWNEETWLRYLIHKRRLWVETLSWYFVKCHKCCRKYCIKIYFFKNSVLPETSVFPWVAEHIWPPWMNSSRILCPSRPWFPWRHPCLSSQQPPQRLSPRPQPRPKQRLPKSCSVSSCYVTGCIVKLPLWDVTSPTVRSRLTRILCWRNRTSSIPWLCIVVTHQSTCPVVWRRVCCKTGGYFCWVKPAFVLYTSTNRVSTSHSLLSCNQGRISQLPSSQSK